MVEIKNRVFSSPLEATITILEGKYKILILFFLINQTLRFTELQHCIPNATPKMLSQQLKELERDGLINRVIYPVVPPKTEYSLTDLGESLLPLIKLSYEWGEKIFELHQIENTSNPDDVNRMFNAIVEI